jgi:hypothetical protein
VTPRDHAARAVDLFAGVVARSEQVVPQLTSTVNR